MNEEHPGPAGFDTRMRRLFGDADTSRGFEARVLARVAALSGAPADDWRARADRRRELARRRLRREVWTNTVTAAGVGAAAIGLVWRHGPAVAGWMQEALAATLHPGVLAGVALAAIVAGLWPMRRRFTTHL